MVNKAEC
jgi:hypothetical protein